MSKEKYSVLFRVAIGFSVILAVLFIERLGILYGDVENDVDILNKEQITHIKESASDKTCLLVIHTNNEISRQGSIIYKKILEDMRVPYDTLDMTGFEGGDLQERFSNYKTVVLSLPEYEVFDQDIISIGNYVENGGRVLVGMPDYKSENFTMISEMMGITNQLSEFGMVDSFVSDKDFMLGAQKAYQITDGYASSMDVELDSECRVYATTGDGSIPLIWSRDYGGGKFVVCNFGYMDKPYLGVFSGAYSLLEDVFIYPVINANTFYLDDFPSPIPSGDGEYIQRDYNMDVAEFYSNVWWPDLISLGEKHNIRYTGLIIETYENRTSGDLPKNNSAADYYYFGNMILNRGGELGYHGYNHQPLCLPNFVYQENLGYNNWENYEVMHSSIKELIRFSTNIFPEADLQVYVPPSNVLSKEGREMLGKDFDDIRAIASIYLQGANVYVQDFTVAEDGMVETPRIISGGVIDDYMKFAAFSELNFHYVGSHFMHPDDLLDVDRGADLGWEKLKGNIDEYMEWMDESAPYIRHMTGSGMAGAVQRFTNVIPEYNVNDTTVTLNTDGLIDNAYYIVRSNEGEITDANGGELTRLNGSLYLLRVQAPETILMRK